MCFFSVKISWSVRSNKNEGKSALAQSLALFHEEEGKEEEEPPDMRSRIFAEFALSSAIFGVGLNRLKRSSLYLS